MSASRNERFVLGHTPSSRTNVLSPSASCASRAMRQTGLSLSLAVTMALCAPIAVHAEPATAMATGLAASGLVSDLQVAIEEVAARLRADATLASFAIRSDLIIAAENLEMVASSFEGKLFKDLNASEQKVFNDLRFSIDKFHNGNDANLDELNQAINAFSTNLARLPTVTDGPLVTRVEPSYFVVPADGLVDIAVSGSALGRLDARLSYPGGTCMLLKGTETSMSFRCEATKVWHDDEPWAQGELRLRREEPWYRFWKDDVDVAYPLAVRRIDPELGRVSVTARVPSTATERVSRSEERVIRAAPCRTEPATWTFNPNTGYRIDVATIRVTRGPVSGRSHFHGLQSSNSSGFVVTGTARGSGERVFGRCVGGGNGVVITRATWTEHREVEVVDEVIVAENQPIRWGSDVRIKLPENAEGFSGVVTQANGQLAVFSGSDRSEWLEFLHDSESMTVVVRPKAITVAMK
jgi:hypothetical protein